MPYKSKAQQAYFHTHKKELKAQGVNVEEWDRLSKGKKLPERIGKTKKQKAMAKLKRGLKGYKK